MPFLDEHGKLRLSLGLYAPGDTITGLGKTGEGYHTHEDLFWTGFQGDPTKGNPADQSWYRDVQSSSGQTPITSENFNTSFNTGHRKTLVCGMARFLKKGSGTTVLFPATTNPWLVVRDSEG